MGTRVRWKRAQEHYVDSHCGRWKITPEYWSCVSPRYFKLWHDKKVVGGGETQRECKEEAERISLKEKDVS